jgi:hypothetical protein
MSYKLRHFKSQMQLHKVIEANNKTWQLKETVEMLKQQVERLKLELRYKNYEVQQMQESRYTADEVYSIISTMLLSIDDTDELARNLLVCDRLIKNVLYKLQNAVEVYNSSFSD